MAPYLLELAPGNHGAEIGVGSGKILSQITSAIEPGGLSCGIDFSEVMLSLSTQQNKARLCRADARQIPLVSDYFDQVYIYYVLDLVPVTEIPRILSEMLIIVKRGGRILIVAMTEGMDLASKGLVAVWKTAYAVSPIMCARCRLLQTYNLLTSVRFKQICREVIVQMGAPREILTAIKLVTTQPHKVQGDDLPKNPFRQYNLRLSLSFRLGIRPEIINYPQI
jgi:ubiquinone/menaquinone biosynthesis C-methylase UbiE